MADLFAPRDDICFLSFLGVGGGRGGYIRIYLVSNLFQISVSTKSCFKRQGNPVVGS